MISGIGTNRKCHSRLATSVIGGITDIPWPRSGFGGIADITNLVADFRV